MSRLELLAAAVEREVQQLSDDTEVALVSFSSDVHLVGDTEAVVAGDRLDDWDQLTEYAWSANGTKRTVLPALHKLTEGGQTALGPALLLAIDAAGPGGRVVLATDGRANVGLGRLDNAALLNDSEQFYVELGERARVAGVTV